MVGGPEYTRACGTLISMASGLQITLVAKLALRSKAPPGPLVVHGTAVWNVNIIHC